ncbi:MAG TPA: hypothetical protein VGA02_00780 [Gemmatimonadales bacterium]
MQHSRESRPFRLALVAACALVLIAAPPVVAQQATDAGLSAAASAGVRALSLPGSADHIVRILSPGLTQPATGTRAPADASARLAGPRVRPEVRGVEPRIAEDGASAMPAAARNNTIVISTLALVLIAVIITILVVK